ncbi:unnamed protein product [Fusarium graminearum]|uniref:Zinc-regulated transporter 2 n=1 Tax=Gibberella zeae TaxID=5518 RepID=A0A4E9DNY3_GIBZA|nr:unnamed protein product [Fusarium graminearum]CAF3566868.1 unnamed protein product [Fusarium graminearum]CAG1961760.1 unnamed protein product [Fusarium graminearum]
MDSARPVCGSDGPGEEYPLGMHIGGLFAVLSVSCLGAGFPVAAKRIKWLKMPPKVFFACKHFGTGVLVATAFVHLLPTAFGSLTNPCLPELFTDIYPAMPGVIMMTSMFLLFMVELYLNAKTGGHSHGGPTGTTITAPPPPRPQRPQRPFPQDENHGHARNDSFNSDYSDDEVTYEKAMAREMYEKEQRPHAYSKDDSNSTMPAWFVVFYEQYVRQRSEMIEMIKESQYSQAAIDSKPHAEVSESYFDEENNSIDQETFKRMSMNITLLEGGILFHSVFVGMTIAMTTDGLLVFLIAIMFHQMFEGLGLGSRIAAVPYPKGSVRPWLLVFAFGCTAPIGQAIGIASRNSYDPESEMGLIMVGVFNSISSGLLIYAALINLLAEDFLSEEAQHLMKKKDQIFALCWIFLGDNDDDCNIAVFFWLRNALADEDGIATV